MIRRLAAGALAAALGGSPASAAPPDPTLPVLTFHAGVAVLSRKDPEADRRLVKRLAAKTFDMDAMAGAVLGDQAGRASAAQKARLEDVFVRLIAGRLEKDDTVGPGAVMTVLKVTPMRSGDEWLVSTRTVRGRLVAPLVWRVRAERGGPRIVDVMRAGSSLTAVEHARIAQDLSRRGLDAVIAELETSAN
jgi:ABC-type transporter MlaC component